ncbi:MAG: MFS transporter [Chloroflexi bacterium]|nr:MFS transporter [Chloroflexota bacterium]
MPGSARLEIVLPVATISFFYSAVLEYALPLYFSALSAAAGNRYSADLWSLLSKYQIAPFIIFPVVAGLLVRHYGEAKIWSAALLGHVLIPLAYAFAPEARFIPLVALWQGMTSALLWTAGISLVQMVAPERRGLAMGLWMAGLGVGGLLGPVAGRLLLYRHELTTLAQRGAWSAWASRLASLAPLQTKPQVDEFNVIFVILAASMLISGVLVALLGQYPGQFERKLDLSWRNTLHDLGQLVSIPHFWLLGVTICLLGGLPLMASNQFLPYRAEVLGLKDGARDSGWFWLQLIRTFMWLLGGVAVGFFAGRRVGRRVAASMVAAAALAAIAVGLSQKVWQLFASVAVFEFFRQFVRWLQTGYLAEHMPGNLRATAIGFALALAGLGHTMFAWAAAYMWDPTNQSGMPFLFAALLGGVGGFGLFLVDRWWPIHTHEPVVGEAVI